MKVRDRELEFDIFDVENAEKYEAAITKVTAANVKVEGETLANTIRKECEVIFDFFDSIFGEGFHHELFGERTNLMDCLDTFAEFVKYVDTQKAALEERMNKYTPNRAARRATTKVK